MCFAAAARAAPRATTVPEAQGNNLGQQTGVIQGTSGKGGKGGKGGKIRNVYSAKIGDSRTVSAKIGAGGGAAIGKNGQNVADNGSNRDNGGRGGNAVTSTEGANIPGAGSNGGNGGGGW